jgi:hypothetical protein
MAGSLTSLIWLTLGAFAIGTEGFMIAACCRRWRSTSMSACPRRATWSRPSPSPTPLELRSSPKTGDDAWRIVMAVAGFSEAELNVTQREDTLLVMGRTAPNGEDQPQYLVWSKN